LLSENFESLSVQEFKDSATLLLLKDSSDEDVSNSELVSLEFSESNKF
jgi:hypothetical protein